MRESKEATEREEISDYPIGKKGWSDEENLNVLSSQRVTTGMGGGPGQHLKQDGVKTLRSGRKGKKTETAKTIFRDNGEKGK